MSFEAEQALMHELSHDEGLLWSGMPRQGFLLRPQDAIMIPFSLIWGGGAIFWEYTALHSDAPLFFKLWGVPFVLVGLYLILGRFLVDSYIRTRTYYGVTNLRIIILSGFSGREVKSLALKGLNQVSLSERPDASGNITFGSPLGGGTGWSGTAQLGMAKYAPQSFEAIAEVRQVYETIREAQRKAAEEPPDE